MLTHLAAPHSDGIARSHTQPQHPVQHAEARFSMPKLLLGQDMDRSLAVLYRPLPAAQSRRSAKWQDAAAEAFTTDKVKQDAHGMASGATHGALVQGAALVDIDAY